MVRQTAALGALLAGAAGLVGWAAGGRVAGLAAFEFGALAAVLQTVAATLAAPKLAAGDYRGLLWRWSAGMGVRFLGILVLPVAVLADRRAFPPLPCGLGYLAVLVPLLFFEIRRFR